MRNPRSDIVMMFLSSYAGAGVFVIAADTSFLYNGEKKYRNAETLTSSVAKNGVEAFAVLARRR